MELEDLLLAKEESPIVQTGCASNPYLFALPIHPLLLRTDIILDSNIAQNVFPQAAKEWQADLNVYKQVCSCKQKKWIDRTFLYKPVEVIKTSSGHRMHPPSEPWSDFVSVGENNVATCIGLKGQGSKIFVNNIGQTPGGNFLRKYSKIDWGKISLFKLNPEEEDYINFISERGTDQKFVCYKQGSVDSYPSALFLRNWGILYLNEAVTQAYSQIRTPEKILSAQ